MNWKRILAAALVLVVVTSGAVSAAGFSLDPTADQYPETKYDEEDLVVVEHDREEMNVLEWENDEGEIVPLKAHINATDEGEKLSYLPSQLEDAEFREYPRKDEEENNSASALDASEWSTGGAQSANISVSDAEGDTAPGKAAVQIATDGTVGTSDEAYVSYANQSITSDVLKRHAQLILDADTLDSSAEIQFRDSGGDYAVAELNSSRDGTADDVITNQTGDGIIFQAQIGELPVVSGDDGSLDAIEEIRVVAGEDVDMTLTAVNVEKKEKWDFGTTRVADTDTDDTDDYEDSEVYQNPDGGPVKITGLDTLGSWSSDATIHDLQYLQIEYRMQDAPSTVDVAFKEADDYPGYAFVLDLSWKKEIPTGYDLEHGDIDLVTEQTFLADRYIQLRYAEAVGDTDTDDIDDSTWTDLSGSLGDRDITITADDTVQAGSTNVVQYEVKLQEEQKTALELTSAGGFWGAESGGSPFANMWNWMVGGVVGLLGALGIKLRSGS